jgi:hypothetical protein
MPAVSTPLEVSIGSRRFKLMSEPRILQISRFPAKLITGDVQESNEQNASAYVVSDLSGGIGVLDMNEDTQQDRSWWSKAWTLNSGWIGLPLEAVDCSGGTASQIFQFANDIYAVIATDIKKWNDATSAWGSSLATITGLAYDHCEYNGTIYIARGADGYTYSSDGTTWADNTADAMASVPLTPSL